MNKLLICTYILLLISIQYLFSQISFVKTIDGGCTKSEGLQQSIQTKDGGYLLAGYTNCSGIGSYDFSIVKLDINAEIEWNIAMGSTAQDYAMDICEISDTSFAIVGYGKNLGAGANDILLTCVSINGTILWTSIIGFSSNETAYDILKTKDNSLLVISEIRNADNTYDVMLSKLDLNGNHLWSKKYGTTKDEWGPFKASESLTGSIFVSGICDYIDSNGDAFVLSVDKDGNYLWSNIISTSDPDRGIDIYCENNEVYVLARYTYNYNSTYAYYRPYITKMDENGNEFWTVEYVESQLRNQDPVSFVKTNSGFVISTESTNLSSSKGILSLIGTNNSGDLQWANEYYIDNVFNYGSYVSLTIDSSLLLCGQAQSVGSAATNYDYLLFKTDLLGSVSCNQHTISSISSQSLNISSSAVAFTQTTISPTLYSSITNNTITAITENDLCYNGTPLVTEIEENLTNNQMVAFYNNNNIYIKSLTDISYIQIMDAMGRLIKYSKIENIEEQVSLSISNIKSGLYWIMASNIKGEKYISSIYVSK